MATKLSAKKQEAALQVVAAYLGKFRYMTEDGSPTPTGKDAAYSALGPMLNPAWDWPSVPTPTILLEGEDDWAYDICSNSFAQAEFAKLGIFAEPYAGYALCLYVN